MQGKEILRVSNLAVDYEGRTRSSATRVLNEVSFSISAGETVALVGESGSGKSTIGNAVLGLVPVAAGEISFEGAPLQTMSARGRRAIAPRLQAIFQNPYGSLNPALTIGTSLSEPLRAAGVDRSKTKGRVRELLESVHLSGDVAERYPASFSGGQRQRIAIARAVALEPKLIVCDEPTSALDVSTQASVLDLLAELQKRIGVAYLFITHDLAVVRHFANRALVLQNGSIVESGASEQICDAPQHPYTRSLVDAAPVPDPRIQRQRRENRIANRGASG